MGAGYDLSVSTFSPDGRVFQVEYAAKAVDNSGTTLSVVCKDGIVFAVEKLLLSVMAVPGTAPRIFAIDRHATIVVAGFIADGREIVSRARLEASEYRRVYDEPIPGRVLSEHLALFVHAYTLAWSERPFGAAILLGVCEKEGLEGDGSSATPKVELYSLDCAGVCYKYYGTALGKGRQSAKTEIEKLDRENLTMEECLVQVAKIMHKVHDETKEKDMELEMAWIGASSNWQHQLVPKDLMEKAEEQARKLLEAEDEDVDMPMS